MEEALSSGEIELIMENIDEIIIEPPVSYGNTGGVLYGTQHLYAQSNVSGTTTGTLEFMWNIEDEELQKSGCMRVIVQPTYIGNISYIVYMPSGTDERRAVSSFRGEYDVGYQSWVWNVPGKIFVEDNYMGGSPFMWALQYKVNEETSMLEVTGYIHIWNINDWANTPYVMMGATDYSALGVETQITAISIYCQSPTHPTYFSNLRFTTYETGFLPYLGKGYPPRLGDLSEYLVNQSYTVIY